MSHILIVEDDEPLRLVLQSTLEGFGHRVSTAANGREGVAVFRRDAADIVLTDIVMPDQEGLETIQALHRLPAPPSIIAMSGGGRLPAQNYLGIASRFGAAATLMKPFAAEELRLAIEYVLERKVIERPAESGNNSSGSSGPSRGR